MVTWCGGGVCRDLVLPFIVAVVDVAMSLCNENLKTVVTVPYPMPVKSIRVVCLRCHMDGTTSLSGS